jgi:hypothetical protein
MLPKVQKRDGSIEKFSYINISKVGMASGLTPEQSKVIAELIGNWAMNLHVEQITSLQIRDKMIEELPKINENAAEMYRWYEQTKEM